MGISRAGVARRICEVYERADGGEGAERNVRSDDVHVLLPFSVVIGLC